MYNIMAHDNVIYINVTNIYMGVISADELSMFN